MTQAEVRDAMDDYDSDLEDYDTDAKETANYVITLFTDADGGLNEYYEKRAVHPSYPIDGNVQDRPWAHEGVKKKDFFNFGMNEHQWKLVANKHIMMLYEKHMIIKTHPNIQAAQNLALKQLERGIANPGMLFPGYQMMMQYPFQYYQQDDNQNNQDNDGSQYSG
eukprot:CAMPEP_0168327616 /NCGR_PEP_ID=MMETSP0213-20121227/5997_1 /TAXON_ID=151035 /ORGANISM="Euplotes harpa, Strain FSP1.4" /LENGTH=164 /DNA_ID=CAMNT_0008330541 /DNA_START=8 /DNA_END=502 /DNA_ORIENTATION=-